MGDDDRNKRTYGKRNGSESDKQSAKVKKGVNGQWTVVKRTPEDNTEGENRCKTPHTKNQMEIVETTVQADAEATNQNDSNK